MAAKKKHAKKKHAKKRKPAKKKHAPAHRLSLADLQGVIVRRHLLGH